MSKAAPVTQQAAEKVMGKFAFTLKEEVPEVVESLSKVIEITSEDNPRTAMGAFLYMGSLLEWASRIQDAAAASLYADGTTTREMSAILADNGIEMSYQTVYRRVLRGMELAGVDPETMREEPKP